MFVNRVREMEFLERMFHRAGAQMVVVWGRRRVGKTALLQHFALRKRMLYHVGTLSTERMELERWSARAAEFFQDPLLVAQPLTSWEAVLAYLTDRAGRADGEWGVVFDEFPHLVQSSPRLPSLLQAAWDGGLKETPIRVVLCGSSVAMMETTFFSQRAPLYGRRTGQWKVEPFDVCDLGQLFPGRGLVDLLELYCVIGGVPLYAERFDQSAPLLRNIRDHILAKGELLYEEVPFLLREELREPRVYQSILAVIAGGAHRFGEISSKTGLDRAHLTGYLATLAELGLLAREVPVTETQPEKSRRGRYLILDPYVRFWYRFVFANFSRLEAGDEDGVLSSIAAQLHDYVSLNVEAPLASICRRGPLRGLVPFEPVFVGRHWSPGEEFDIVALDGERKRAFVAEVKWSAGPVSAALAADLQQRIHACEALRGMDVTVTLISRSGFRGEQAPGAIYVDLSRMGTSYCNPSHSYLAAAEGL